MTAFIRKDIWMKKLILAAAGCAPPIQTSARSEIFTRAYSGITVSLFSRPAAAVAAKAYREGDKVLL